VAEVVEVGLGADGRLDLAEREEGGTPDILGDIRAGLYGHKLPGVGEERSALHRKAIAAGTLALKPGWVRLRRTGRR